jgi:hypothetical protein
MYLKREWIIYDKNDRNDKWVVVQSIIPMITSLLNIGLNHTTESLAGQMIQMGKF